MVLCLCKLSYKHKIRGVLFFFLNTLDTWDLYLHLLLKYTQVKNQRFYYQFLKLKSAFTKHRNWGYLKNNYC